MAVSPDFISATLQSLLAEFREIKTTADLDRRNARMSYDNLAAEVARAIGGIDAKLEMAVAHVDERFAHIDERFDRIEALLMKDRA